MAHQCRVDSTRTHSCAGKPIPERVVLAMSFSMQPTRHEGARVRVLPEVDPDGKVRHEVSCAEL